MGHDFKFHDIVHKVCSFICFGEVKHLHIYSIDEEYVCH